MLPDDTKDEIEEKDFEDVRKSEKQRFLLLIVRGMKCCNIKLLLGSVGSVEVANT